MSGAVTDEAARRPLVVACGALVSELRSVLDANGLSTRVDVVYLPANLHNRPERIAAEVRAVLAEHDALSPDGRPVLLGYGDCGSGGALDALIAEYPHVQRLPGDHCYAFFSSVEVFATEHEAELGTFYLTDFLAKHFDALVWSGLGLDRHPQLLSAYFGNYTRLLLLSQGDDPAVVTAARRAAEMLGLRFEHRHTGLDPLGAAVAVRLSSPLPNESRLACPAT